MGAKLAVFLLALAAGGALAPAGHAATYYVSPQGSDGSAGTAPDSAWRTVSRVNSAQLAPGDVVLFQGGQTFSDSTLMPSTSGAAGAPITFGSYGSGPATITDRDGAVWFSGKSYLTFERLRLTTGGANAVIFAGSGGAGSRHITLRSCVLEDSAYAAVNSPNPDDAYWRIEGNTITHVGDSGLIVLGSNARIVGNRISDTGWNPALDYGKHGIYAKGPEMTIADNDISQNANGSGISLRFHGAQVYGNAIHDTRYAISYFPDDPANAGSLHVYGNRIWNVAGYALYYSGTTSAVDLVFVDNTVVLTGAEEAVNVSEARSANVTLANNIFTGSYGSALRAPASAGGKSFSEHDNVWFGGARNVPAGSHDRYVDPLVGAAPGLALSNLSPVVDAGSRSARELATGAPGEGSGAGH